ncbi:tRNA pseudouridine(13) synthase TruD [Legionella sp. W05-934-2]|jgi:tRNA pseudouridine13 synthase|uniref:tRNA pseudouridine(13) synthase TruD n=1 Tax=Legionella sp. W05-934-2 TaxID=1198649 RepID=UPI003462301B
MIQIHLHFSHAWGGPTSPGFIKQSPEDFRVEELSNIEFSDSGEHLYLQVEKTNLTTEQCSQSLARIIKKPANVVSYAGLKDKFGITTQWFSIHCPGEDVSPLIPDQHDGWRILQRRRHHKKLKIGWLKGNRFQLIVRDVTRTDMLDDQLKHIQQQGLPNYFGPQRFGNQGNNIYQAWQWFNGHKKVKNPFMKGMLLSAVRGYLFNQQLSLRVQQQNWQKAIPGDVLQLSGTHSVFVADKITPDIQLRIYEHDLSPCGQLVGKERIMSNQEAYQIMQDALNPYQAFVDALIEKNVSAAWRAFILKPVAFEWEWLAENQIKLNFELPAGAYATTILTEVFQIQERLSP